MKGYALRLTRTQFDSLRAHLYPGDMKEAVALVLCGRRDGKSRHLFLGHEVHPVPYEACTIRSADRVTWTTGTLRPLLERASKRHFGILKVHSHPSGYPRFSTHDDKSDGEVLGTADAWADDGLPHASAVMLPDGTFFGRVRESTGQFLPLDSVTIVGDEIDHRFQVTPNALGSFTARTAQAFGEGTTGRLKQLSIAVVGCSGTGSIVIELLHRLGTGRLLLVDPQAVGVENLNRIPQATRADALARRQKVAVLREAIDKAELGCEVVCLDQPVEAPDAVRQIAECDVVFGCMDGAEGRDTLNRLASFYLLPYFDVGVRLDADGKGGIDQIVTAVHYLKPGGSSLLSRGVYTMEDVRAEHLRRHSPDSFDRERREGYIKGVLVDRPAVISVNTHAASMVVNEFLARLHPYRDDPNSDYASYRMSLTQGCIYKGKDGDPCAILSKWVGRGDMEPLLNRSEP